MRCLLLHAGLHLRHVLLRLREEESHVFVEFKRDFSLEITDSIHLYVAGESFVLGFEFFERADILHREEFVYQFIRLHLGYIDNLVQEFFEDYESLCEVLLVVSAQMPLLGNRRHGKTRIQECELLLEPFEIAVPSFHLYVKWLDQYLIDDV